jgi:hypothetical protein
MAKLENEITVTSQTQTDTERTLAFPRTAQPSVIQSLLGDWDCKI